MREIVYEGDGFAIFPGDPLAIPKDMETVFKKIAYTSERGIDWDVEQVAERVGTKVMRGVVIKVDDWLFDKYMNYKQ